MSLIKTLPFPAEIKSYQARINYLIRIGLKQLGTMVNQPFNDQKREAN